MVHVFFRNFDPPKTGNRQKMHPIFWNALRPIASELRNENGTILFPISSSSILSNNSPYFGLVDF